MKKLSEHDLFDAITNIDNKYIKNAEIQEELSAHNNPANSVRDHILADDLLPFSEEAVADAPTRVAKPAVNRLWVLIAAAAVLLLLVGGAYTYRMFHKPVVPDDSDENLIANASTEVSPESEAGMPLTDGLPTEAFPVPTDPVPTDALPTPTDATIAKDSLHVPESSSWMFFQRGDLGNYVYDSLTFDDPVTTQALLDELRMISGESDHLTGKALLEKRLGHYLFSLNCYSTELGYTSYCFLSETSVLECVGDRYHFIHTEEPVSILKYISLKVSNPTFVPNSPYDWANTQYMIIEIGEPTSHIFRTSLTGLEYVEVSCKVLYGNDEDVPIGVSERGYTWHVPIYNIEGIYIRKDMVDEFTSHKLILSRRGSLRDRYQMDYFHLEGKFCFVGFDENDLPEYLTFDDGKLQLPESNPSECLRSFASLYALNEEVDRLIQQGANEKNMPLKKITDGMTVQEVIDYFNTFRTWVTSQEHP